MGAISAILVAEKKVSLISFSGQSLPLLFGRIAQFRSKNLRRPLWPYMSLSSRSKTRLHTSLPPFDEQSATSEEVVRNIADSTALSREVERKTEEIAQEFNSFKKASEDLAKIVEGFKV